MPTRSYSWISPPRASGVVSAPSPHRTYLVSSDRQAEQKARNSAAGQLSARGISSSVTGRGWRACRRGPLGRSPRRPAWRGPAGRPCRTGGRARRRRRSPARPPCRTAQGANARRPPQERASAWLPSLTREVRRRVHGEINKDPRGTAPDGQPAARVAVRDPLGAPAPLPGRRLQGVRAARGA